MLAVSTNAFAGSPASSRPTYTTRGGAGVGVGPVGVGVVVTGPVIVFSQPTHAPTAIAKASAARASFGVNAIPRTLTLARGALIPLFTDAAPRASARRTYNPGPP